MDEVEIVVDKLRLNYEGIFSAKDFFNMIDDFLDRKGFEKKDLKHIERITPEGKHIEYEMIPWKKFTDYSKCEIRARVTMTEVKEVEMEKDGMKMVLNKGKIKIVMDGYLTTDYENRWESKPAFMFIRAVFDKYFYKPFTSGYQNDVGGYTKDFYNQMKAFLNLYRY